MVPITFIDVVGYAGMVLSAISLLLAYWVKRTQRELHELKAKKSAARVAQQLAAARPRMQTAEEQTVTLNELYAVTGAVLVGGDEFWTIPNVPIQSPNITPARLTGVTPMSVPRYPYGRLRSGLESRTGSNLVPRGRRPKVQNPAAA